MNKKISIVFVNFVMILCIMTSYSLGFSLNIDIDKKKIEKDEEFKFTIETSEDIIGASFKIDYDLNNIEFIESKTSNLNVSVDDGKLACVYLDVLKKGTNKLEIRFKAKNTLSNITFNIEDGKFITKTGEKIYKSSNEISGLTKKINLEETSNVDNNKNQAEDNKNNTTNIDKNNEQNNSSDKNKSNTISNTNSVVNNKDNAGNNENNKTNNSYNTSTSNSNNTKTTSKKDDSTSKNIIPYTGTSSNMRVLKYIALGLLGVVTLRMVINFKSKK